MSEVCRICRGESTPIQPLYHPCKCRGSIKYIHQDCLMEWLRHSSKKAQECDICHSTYKFKTIYDPSMPETIPLKFIWSKLWSSVGKNFIKSISITFYIMLILEVPIFWKFIGRIYTWTIDGKLPVANPKFIDALFFGEYDLSTYQYADNADLFFIYKLRKIFEYTYFSGLRYLIVYIIIHIALFVEREWVVRDEGFNKLLLKKVGQEPRTKLIDMFQNVINDMRNEDNRMDDLMRAVNDLRDQEQGVAGGNEMIDLIRQNPINFDDTDHEDNDQNQPVSDHESNDDNEHENSDQEDSEREDDDTDRVMRDGYVQFMEVLREAEDERGRAREIRARERARRDEERQEIERQEIERQEIERQEIERERQIENDALQAALEENNNNDDDNEFVGDENIFEMFGLKLNLTTPIFLIIICDMIISVYLFITYLMPQSLGSVIIYILGLVISVLKTIIPSININIPGSDKIISRLDPQLINFSIFIGTDVILPIFQKLENLFTNNNTPSTLERMICLFLGYSTIALLFHQFMKSLIRSKPVTGNPRKVYKICFEAVITLKVFIIFAIEIFIFPVYCGWLIDFCAAPLLLDSFTFIENDQIKYRLLFTSISDYLTIDYVRVAIYWAIGTLYMLFFALFIGMIRSKILRPGVLFFIRSPDDPNARLIHDALVKPMMLQLSRIYLSGKVYTGFIIIGIGGITWGFRWLIKPISIDGKLYNVLLPIKMYHSFQIFLVVTTILTLINNKAIINQYSEKYWTKAFELSCHKLRLSHFILGRPIAQERGYIVYSSTLNWILGIPPDYSRPVTYNEAKALRDESESYFVPNGGYIRVPDNDTVSRKFVKQLFVSVTKDDKLLAPIEPVIDDEDESDGEISENNYTTVYKPPYLKLRCFGLIALLWVFAVLLIVGLIMISLVIGKPISKFFMIMMNLNQSIVLNGSFKMDTLLNSVNEYDWKVADIGSIAVGIFAEFQVLQYFHFNYSGNAEAAQAGNVNVNNNNRAGDAVADGNRGEGAAVNAAENRPGIIPRNGLRRLGFGFQNFTPWQMVITCGIMTTSIFFSSIFIFSIHKFVIDIPVKILRGYDKVNIGNDFILDFYTIVYHLIVSPWTVIPFMKYFFNLSMRNIDFSIGEIIKHSELIDNLIRLSVIQLPSAIYMTIRSYQGSIEKHDMYCMVVLFSGYVISDLVKKGNQLLNKLVDEVKNEKYVTGKALENVD